MQGGSIFYMELPHHFFLFSIFFLGLMALYNLDAKNCVSFASDGARKIIHILLFASAIPTGSVRN